MSDKNPFDDNDGLDDLDDFNSSGDEFDSFDETVDFDDTSSDDDMSSFSNDENGSSFGMDDDPDFSNEEEEVDEEGFTPKPFLKTPVGMLSIAAGVVAAVVAGINVTGVMSPSAPPPLQNADYIPTPTTPQDAEMRRPFPSGGQNEQRVEESPENLNGDQMPVIGDNILSLQDTAKASEVSLEVESLKEKLESELDVISEIQKELAETKAKLERLQKAFENSERERIKAGQGGAAVEAQVVDAVSAALKAERQKEEELAAQAVKEAELKKEQERIKSLTRLPDLIVIDSSANGDMMIIRKVSNGRVFTLFKGERVITPFGRFSVTELDPEAGRIIVGDKYAIDRETPPARKAPVAKKKPVAATPKKPAEPVLSKALTLSAVFEEGKSFGVVNDKGEFNVYRVGDRIPGVGTVQGLNDENVLKAGNTLIKKGF